MKTRPFVELGARRTGADRSLLVRWLIGLLTIVCCANAIGSPAYVQGGASVAQSPVSSLSVTYASAQTAGNLNVVAISWQGSGASVQSVTDASGNLYALAVGPTTWGSASQVMYYAKNIAGAASGTNTITVTFSVAVSFPDVRVAEYSGLSPTNPQDVAAGASGNGTFASTDPVTTTDANDILVAADYEAGGTTGPGSGYTQEIFTTFDDILEDQLVSATGAYIATAPTSLPGDGSTWWLIQLVAFRAADTTGDAQSPTTPTGLTATATSGSEIDLSWTASTDNVGVSGYRVERCQGNGCSAFSEIGTATGTTFSDTTLNAVTTYTYRIRAIDAVGNLSGYSTAAGATTPSPSITFVQVNSATPQTPQSSVAATYNSAQRARDLNVVVVGWNDSTAHVSSVADSSGNTYALAVGPTVQSGTATQAIYYAVNIASAAAGNNTVTVSFDSPANYVDLRIAEYAGIATVSPVDVVSASSGNGDTADSGPVGTSYANDLILGADVVQSGSPGPGSEFTSRIITAPDSDILEDQVVAATGAYSGSAPVWPAASWLMQMVAFKGASSGGGGDTHPPSTPAGLAATAASSSEIDLTWSASTDNVGVTGYLLERCQGTSCSTFAQIATPATTSYSDTGLSASTSYTYRVRATDAAGNTSAYSGSSSATTSAGGGGGGGDTQPPTAPAGVAAGAISGSQISLSWSASTDDVGVAGYLIERCQGASCTSFVQIATPTATSYNDAGLSPSTPYSYRVRATDAAGNLSAYSNTVSATTGDGSGLGGSTTSTYTYDAQGRLQSVTTSNGTATQYIYDAAGHVVNIQTH